MEDMKPDPIQYLAAIPAGEATKLQEFQKQLLEDIAAATGVTYEQVVGRIDELGSEVSVGELREVLAREKSQQGAPPRQLSAIEGHPWYNEKLVKGAKVGVRFNGTDRKGDVMEYDADAGFIRVHIRDNKGNWKKSRGRFVSVKLSGEVVPFWK